MSQPSVVEVEPARFAEIEPRVTRIDAHARAADGHSTLGDAVWLDLDEPRPDSAGFLAGDRAYAHVARADNSAPHDWTLGIALAPDGRDDGSRRALLAAAVGHVAQRGGGRIVLWFPGARPDDDTELAAAGFTPARDLYEMRAPLPITEQPRWPLGVLVRTFEVGRDEAEWLEVNNRAFAGHAEQGGWTVATLTRRIAEPWFDPAIFLLAHDAEGMVGFNWLKMHEPTAGDPRLGEIYVIGVDPRAQGTGLGRALAIDGLRVVHERGAGTGMLFCAADNDAALELYRSLGFDVHRVDRAYEREVAPA